MQTSRRPVQAGRFFSALCVPLVILTSVHAARAQSSVATTRDGWTVGALVGRLAVGGDADAHATAIGLGVSRFTPRRPGLDLAVVTLPRLFRSGQIPLHARMGAAIPLGPELGPYLVPTLGVDAGGTAGDRADGWVGFHWGAHALFAARQFGVQAGVVWVRATGASNNLWLAEIGLVRLPVPGPPRPRSTTHVPGET